MVILERENTLLFVFIRTLKKFRISKAQQKKILKKVYQEKKPMVSYDLVPISSLRKNTNKQNGWEMHIELCS